MRRVVQFSTGNVGQHSLKAIIGRPDLELVGLHAASPNKIGRDASELCGLKDPTGIIATDDIDALIALKPDCVVYTAQGETRPMEALEQMSKFLAAGINVAATSMVWLVTPRQADDWLLEPLEKACQAGNASLYVNGIDPGYSGDTEVHSALSLVTRATSVMVQEIFDYANYDDYEFTGVSMGFGLSADADPPMLFLPGVLTTMWGGPVRNLADQLGVELDELRQRIEPWYTDERIECKMATIEPGQNGGRPVRGRRGTRRGSSDHDGAHHPADRGVGAGLGVSARRQARCPPRGGRRRAPGRTQHTCVRPCTRRHRSGMRVHGCPGGQRHRLALRRARGFDRGGGHPAGGYHPRPDVD